MIKPHDFQEDIITKTVDHILSSPKSIVISASPGAGKTVMFSFTIQRLIRRYRKICILIIAHKHDLIKQAEKTVRMANPDAEIGIFCASMKRFEQKQITIGSRDTLRSRLDTLGKFDVIMIDEAHKVGFGTESKPSSYARIIEKLKAVRPACRLIGYTGTAYRQGMGAIHGANKPFDELLCDVSIKWCLDNGYLCDVRSSPTLDEAKIDTSDIKLVAGDFSLKGLQEVATKESLVKKMVDDWQLNTRRAGKKCTMFFCSGKKHGQMISTELTRLGYSIPFVDQTMDIKKRDALIEDLSEGRIDGLVNFGLYTEGTDIPRIDCVVIARPAKVLSLYIQMVTRVVRLFEGKEYGLLLDYGGCIERFGPIDCAEPEEPKQKDSRVQPCPNKECGCLISIYANKCKVCGEVIKEIFKTCGKCIEKNAPSAKECKSCGELFFDHDFKSHSSIDVISDRSIRRPALYVKSIIKISSAGNRHLRIILKDRDLGSEYYKAIYHGYRGTAGIISRRELSGLIEGSVPRSLEGAIEKLDKSNMDIKYVDVDKYGKVKRIQLNKES